MARQPSWQPPIQLPNYARLLDDSGGSERPTPRDEQLVVATSKTVSDPITFIFQGNRENYTEFSCGC